MVSIAGATGFQAKNASSAGKFEGEAPKGGYSTGIGVCVEGLLRRSHVNFRITLTIVKNVASPLDLLPVFPLTFNRNAIAYPDQIRLYRNAIT